MSRNNAPMGRHGVFGRVVVHADLDCFYCQVEHVRLGIPQSTPLAVQQWDGIIAVNYEARKFGVKRGDRADSAKQKCPQIKLVHVQTIGASPAVVEEGDDVGAAGTRHTKATCKVSLERYREASFAIMTIFQAHCRRVEKASIDEAYLDLTEEAARLCQEAEAGAAEDLANAPETDLQGTAGHRVDPTNAFDRALLAGARLTAAIRLAVEQELGFTVSAGIASNKVLAKLASSINKPNKQTVVPAGASSEMLDTVPLRKMRGLGGKLGEAVVSWSKAGTASDLKRFREEELVENFGSKTGEWLWRVCRGMDDEAVVPNLTPKSLSVCKAFTPVRDREAVLTWMTLLCKELALRIRTDREAWRRRATKLTLQMEFRTSGSRTNQPGAAGQGWKNAPSTRSRTVDIPGGGEPPTAESLVSEAMAVFAKNEESLPCCRLALTAHDFSGLVSGRGSIASFLRALPPTSSPPPPPPPPPKAAPCPVTDKSTAVEPARSDMPSPQVACIVGDDVRCARTGRGSHEEVDPPKGLGIGTASGGGGGCIGRSHPVGSEKPPRFHPGGRGMESLEDEECPKCGEAYAADDLQEHLDFHYAQGLQERYTREGEVARDMAAMASNGGAAKRRRQGGERGAKRQMKKGDRSVARIDSFFKPA